MSRLAGRARDDRSQVVRRSAGIVVEHQPAHPTRWIEQQISNQSGPAGLMHGAETGAVVAVEVLIEQQVVFPRRVDLHELDTAVDGPPTIRGWEPYADQPISKIAGDVAQRQL